MIYMIFSSTIGCVIIPCIETNNNEITWPRAYLASGFSYRPLSIFETRIRFAGEDGVRKLSDAMRFTDHGTFIKLPFLMILFTSRCSLSQQ